MNKNAVKSFYETINFNKMINQQAPQLIQEFLSGEIKFITEHIKPNSSILEIGCGYGRLLKVLAENSSELVGIDFSQRMVKLSKQNLAELKTVSIQLMEADKLSFKDESFDYVICMDNSFGNMPNIELDVLKEMIRVCKNGGEVIISVFSDNAGKVQIENYKRIGLTGITDDGTAIHTREGFYSRRFSKKELVVLFNQCGLKCKIITICPVNYIAYAIKTP